MIYPTTYALLKATKTAYEREIERQRKDIAVRQEIIVRLEKEAENMQQCMEYLEQKDKRENITK